MRSQLQFCSQRILVLLKALAFPIYYYYILVLHTVVHTYIRMVRPVAPLSEVSAIMRRFSWFCGFPLGLSRDGRRVSHSWCLLAWHIMPCLLLVAPSAAFVWYLHSEDLRFR